jgi:hypothetical protein
LFDDKPQIMKLIPEKNEQKIPKTKFRIYVSSFFFHVAITAPLCLLVFAWYAIPFMARSAV